MFHIFAISLHDLSLEVLKSLCLDPILSFRLIAVIGRIKSVQMNLRTQRIEQVNIYFLHQTTHVVEGVDVFVQICDIISDVGHRRVHFL